MQSTQPETPFAALERLADGELALRHQRVRQLLASHMPASGGLLVFGKVAVYHLSGTMAAAALWLPVEGRPVLLCRRAMDRARLESPLQAAAFRSYGDLPGVLAEAGSPLSDVVAAELGALSWPLGQNLIARLPGVRLEPADQLVAMAQSVKTPWELAKLRLAGERHGRCLREVIPAQLTPGMNERQISHCIWQAFFAEGHCGLMRMGSGSEEIFLGHVAAGDSGNYPSVFDGPLGLRGEHPAAPCMGYAGTLWQQGQPLALDVGFCLEGYHTDKTQILWSGPESSVPAVVRVAHQCSMEIEAWLAGNLKPGAIPSQLYAKSLDMAQRAGFAEGYLALGGNKVKFVGHGIGLVVAGWPVLAKGFDAPLEAGQTLALEPKIGLPGIGMVGVENTYEVTDAGGRNLTGSGELLCLA